METEIFCCQHLSKQYKNFKALDDVTLKIKQGRIYGLIGKNGAGKTTLMRIISGLTYKTSGTITLYGKENIKEYSKNLIKTGIMIEYPAMNKSMTAKEQIKVIRLLKGIKTDNSDELLKLVGLYDCGRKKIKDFSLGMRQRLGIACALVSNPEFLILDEPVNGLDPVGVVEIRNLIKNLCETKGMTVLISSHNLPELFQTATDYIIIDKGKIKQTLTLEELESKCRHSIHIACDNNNGLYDIIKKGFPDINTEKQADDSVNVYGMEESKDKLMKYLSEKNIYPTLFATQGETLEDYFISVIGGNSND